MSKLFDLLNSIITKVNKAVRYSDEQNLTEEQKLQARYNIGAISEDGVPEQVQADWNQNDKTQPDFVKNRTHYESYVYTDVLCTMKPTVLPSFVMPNVGDKLTIKVNGEYIEDTVKEQMSNMLGTSYTYIGNNDFDSIYSGEEGWIILATGGQVVSIANPDITLTIKNTIVHKIDDKFINFDSVIRTFDYYIEGTHLFRTMYKDNGDECTLYTCDKINQDFLKSGTLCFGCLSEIGFTSVGTASFESCFAAGYIIIRDINGNIGIKYKALIFGTNTSQMIELANGYGYTHSTKPTS